MVDERQKNTPVTGVSGDNRFPGFERLMIRALGKDLVGNEPDLEDRLLELAGDDNELRILVDSVAEKLTQRAIERDGRYVVRGLESGELFGFPCFYFTAEVPTLYDGVEGVYKVDVRMIYDPGLGLCHLPIDLEEARELFGYSLVATVGQIGIADGFDGSRLLNQMLNMQAESQVPLTVILIHGGGNIQSQPMVIGNGKNILAFEKYRTKIEELDDSLRRRRGIRIKEPSIILYAVCGNDSDEYYRIPDEKSSVVFYRSGLVGILRRSGDFLCSRK